MGINAFVVENIGQSVRVQNTEGLDIVSNDVGVLLRAIAESGNQINVVWDSGEFWGPLLTLLPKDKAATLADGKAVYYSGIRLWWGITRHGRAIGIRYNKLSHLTANIYTSYEIEISEIKQYYDNIGKPKSLAELQYRGNQLMFTLGKMNLTPSSLISAAGIYKECVLDKLNLPCMFSMPKETLDCHELAYNTVNEWVANYKSVDDTGVYSYDLTAAYASALAELPNLDYADIVHCQEMPEPGWYWGVMRGLVHNKTLKSPLERPELGRRYVGYWDGVITTDLYASLFQWDIADIEIKEGWFIYLKKYYKPLDYSMRKLYAFRNGDTLQNNLAKAMAVSTWGKMLEVRDTSEGIEYGDLFNAIYGSMVVNAIKTKVVDFIYSNKLQDHLVSVNVDGVKATKKLDITTERHFGEWRLNDG